MAVQTYVAREYGSGWGVFLETGNDEPILALVAGEDMAFKAQVVAEALTDFQPVGRFYAENRSDAYKLMLQALKQPPAAL